MDETLDELSDRLHPRRLLDELLDVLLPSEGSTKRASAQASSKVKQAGKSVSRYVREHPVPAALMAAGVAWAIYDAAQDDEEEWGDYGEDSPYSSTSGDRAAAGFSSDDGEPSTMEKAKDGLSSAKGSAAAAASTAAESVASGAYAARRAGSRMWRRTKRAGRRGYRATGEMSQAAGEYLSAGMERTRQGVRTAQARFDEASDEYPLAVAGGFIAAGLLVGLLLPRTRIEDEWMGEASDEAWDAAKARDEELMEEGKRKAKRPPRKR
jgi:hypothetical protein